MTDRERLVKLMIEAKKADTEDVPFSEFLADFLLANGVIVPPCPIGTKIYMLVTKRSRLTYPEFTFIKDSKLTFNNLERVLEDFGKTVFLTREEAEKALAERQGSQCEQ